MKIRKQKQVNPISDDVSATIAALRPILEGILYGLKGDVVKEVGGYAEVKVKMLNRLYRRGDGDVGLCFEYAVHSALANSDEAVSERVSDSLKKCKLNSDSIASLLFAVEKSGKLDLVDSVREALTDDSRLLYGSRGRPVKLKKHVDQIASAFHRPAARKALPQSISGLWKADLFVGNLSEDGWVGTNVKVNSKDLRAVKGLRLGIVPSSQGKDDRPYKDDQKNLIVCPLPYDGSFMELFYSAWRIVQQFIEADAKLPSEAALPLPHERQVARELAMRREATVLEVIDVLKVQSQPELVETSEVDTDTYTERAGEGDELRKLFLHQFQESRVRTDLRRNRKPNETMDRSLCARHATRETAERAPGANAGHRECAR